jgi:hypothetical protein
MSTPGVIPLGAIVQDFADGIKAVDATRPVAVNQRSGAAFQPGVGPHTEARTVALVVKHLAKRRPDSYPDHALGVSYGDGTRQACDLCLGIAPSWSWAIEVKMLRLMGDNGKPNDNILMHIPSPYKDHRSALTDCDKLRTSALGGQRAVMIYGYDYDGWPMDPAIDAFETLARSRGMLGEQHVASFDGLVHPRASRGPSVRVGAPRA